MKLIAQSIAVAAFAGVALAQGMTDEDRLVLPSGLEATLLEQIAEEGGVHRFRYVAPEFSKAVALETIAADLEHLCAEDALGRLIDGAKADARVVISLADAPSEFGVYDPDVNQVFEAYRVENGLCIWEVF